MSWRDAVALAARSVGRRKARAALTVSAVALAAALLVALLTIAGTARTRVLDQLSEGGPLSGIKVAPAAPDPATVDRDDARQGPARDLDEAALERIRALPDVRSVVPVVSTRVLVLPGDEPVKPAAPGAPAPPAGRSRRDPGDLFADAVVGVDLRQAAILPISILAGRLPGPDAATEVAVDEGYLQRFGLDKAEAARVVGTEVELGAPRLFGEGPGARPRGRWTRRLVVGVVAQEAASGQFLVPLAAAQEARSWTLAGTDAGASFELASSPYSGLYVVASGLDRVGEVRARITAVGYATSAPENLIASVTRYLRVVEIVLSAIGLIALVIAALGIANGLLAAVRERRREIGVLKAIGARDRDVRRTFLVEAAVLGLVGGAFGTLAGWGVARLVGSVVNRYLTSQGLVGVEPSLPFVVVAGGLVGSALVALAAGTFPAVRAARLPAREAVGGA